MSFSNSNTSLDTVSLTDLQAEIERRSKIHKFSIGDVEFELTLEQVKILQKKLEQINPMVKNQWDRYSKWLEDSPINYPQKDITPTPYPHPRFKEPWVDPKYPGSNNPITCQADRVF